MTLEYTGPGIGTQVRKTTVTIPIEVLKEMQLYIARNNLTFRDQSNLIVTALIKFLRENGAELDLNDNEIRKFIVEGVYPVNER